MTNSLLRGISLTAAHLNISKEALQKAIDKVGNSAAAVPKALAV